MTDMGTDDGQARADGTRLDLEVEEAVRAVVAAGYEAPFGSADDDGAVRCGSCGNSLPLEGEAVLEAFAARDTPSARAGLLVVGLRCPRCGALGHAVLDEQHWGPAEDRAAAADDRRADASAAASDAVEGSGADNGSHGALSVDGDTHKSPAHPLGTDREHLIEVEDGDTRSLRERGPLIDEDGADIREYTAEPVETDEGTVIAQQQNVGPGNRAGGGEWPDPRTPPSQSR